MTEKREDRVFSEKYGDGYIFKIFNNPPSVFIKFKNIELPIEFLGDKELAFISNGISHIKQKEKRIKREPIVNAEKRAWRKCRVPSETIDSLKEKLNTNKKITLDRDVLDILLHVYMQRKEAQERTAEKIVGMIARGEKELRPVGRPRKNVENPLPRKKVGGPRKETQSV